MKKYKSLFDKYLNYSHNIIIIYYYYIIIIIIIIIIVTKFAAY